MTNYFDDKQLYPLLFQNDFSKILSFLEKYGLNSVDRNGRSFLMNCITEGKNDFAYKLIELGANLNHQDASGASPLFAAIWAYNIEMIVSLLDNPSVDKNITDNQGRNALRIALQYHPEDCELMIRFIRAGVNPFSCDNNGVSFYDLLQKYASGSITKGGRKLNVKPIIIEIENGMLTNSKPTEQAERCRTLPIKKNMNAIKYKLIVDEPWGFTHSGSNVFHGVVVKQLSPTFLLFKSDNLVSFEGKESHILILKPRYEKEVFYLESDDEIVVGGALYQEKEYEGKDEKYLMSHSKYVVIGRLKKINIGNNHFNS